jgi:predicted O-methyltransferase YrrM
VSPAVDPQLLDLARRTPGFMPDDEGLALHAAALDAARLGPIVEIGTYCGKSSIYLAAAARERGTVVFTVDHHRGSEENQPGQLYHDPQLADPLTGGLDTLPEFRRTMTRAGLDDCLVAVVGRSDVVARHWHHPLGALFIDGGHSEAAAQTDYACWSPHVTAGGLLLIHDVFPDPADGGRPPYDVYLRALRSGAFAEEPGCGSLRVLRRLGGVGGEDALAGRLVQGAEEP